LTIHEILKFYWGFDSFRPLQQEIIEASVRGKDVIGVLPTGSGKSIIYQVAGLKREGLTLVISPLIALIEDQVKKLQFLGIKSIALTGNIPPHELTRLLDNAFYGNTKFLFLSPERLQNLYLQRRLAQAKIGLIAVDEAHCISEWGHDFRPSYLKISVLREIHPETPIIALTATAKRAVINDIVMQLRLKNPLIFKQSVKRENLAFKVFETENKLGSLLQKISPDESAIVYVRTRKRTYQLAEILIQNGLKAGFFHGGMSFEDKQKSMEKWLSGKINIMVSTNAFGMGIDKPDVRKVFHMDLPGSLENYLQEAGRAGRDGKYAEAILFYTRSDIDFYKNVFIKKLPGIQEVIYVYKSLYNHFYIAEGEGDGNEFAFDYKAFCQRFQLPLLSTLDVIKILESEEIISLKNTKNFFSSIKVLASPASIREYIFHKRKYSALLDLLIRKYSDIFHQFQKIHLGFFKESLQISTDELHTQLVYLDSLALIEYKPGGGDFSLVFHLPKDEFLLKRKTKNFQKRIEIKKQQLQNLLQYVLNNQECRVQQLVRYFEEADSEKCGICDVCEREEHKYTPEETALKIMELLETKAMSEDELRQVFHRDITPVLRFLFDRKKINFDFDTGKYKLAQNG